MKSYCFALAAIAAIGFAGAAFAGDTTHSAKSTAPVAMSDSELDSAYAGSVLNRDFLVQTFSVPAGVFHQNTQTGTGVDHFKANCVTNPSGRAC